MAAFRRGRWSIWRDKGSNPWVVEISPSPLSRFPALFDSYFPSSTKGVALQGEILALIEKGAVEHTPPSPGFYSHVFVVMEALGSWKPIIDLAIQNKFVRQSRFKMESNQSVLSAIQRDDWNVLHRPEGCLPSGPCPSGEHEIPSLYDVQQGFSIQGPMFQPLRCLPGSWLLFRPFCTV